VEAVLDPGQVMLDEITALEMERARIEARIAARMLDFADLRRIRAEANPDETARRLEASFAADELGVALHQPTRTVQCRLADARRVRGLLPKTWLAFQSGEIDGYRVSLIASAVDKVRGDNHAVIELDYVVSDRAARQTSSQLKGSLKRFVARNAPSAAAARAERDKRSVWVSHQDDEMSLLHAYIPTADAARIDRLLTDRAKQLPADDRTLDHKRADELVRQLLATGDGLPGSRAVIGITIPVTSLAGLTDEPGESFDGAFALPAELVRELAREPGTLFHRILTDPLGRILDITEAGRFPSAKLRIAVQARDGTCRFPTCTRPAIESDLDHKTPHPRGPTSAANLRALCRRHHNMKTHGVTEPTAHMMHARTPSRAEYALAKYAVRMQSAPG
jgi:hypothetical protein